MASGAEKGQFEIRYADQNESGVVIAFSQHTNVISGGALAAPTGATFEAIPKSFEGLTTKDMLKARGRVLVFFIAEATDIIESEESAWELPGLLLNEQTGEVVSRKTLTQENMTGFTQAGIVDVTATAGVPTRVAYWDVPRGLLFAIDPNGRTRAYIGDDA